MVIIPDECTSLICEPPNSHCKDCSHALFYGTILTNGKEHKFEFSPQYGVWFLTKTGEHRKRQPAEKNPVWIDFQIWHDAKFGPWLT